MLFSSVEFLFLFLPSVVFIFFISKKYFNDDVLKLVLLFASLFFYGYFKYINFFASIASAVSGVDFVITKVILPIGISFFTFQCIMFVVDHRNKPHNATLLDFAVYITFFPQLIAGPIVRPDVLLSQIQSLSKHQITSANWSAGLLLISIGLFKKAFIADQFAPYADKIFGLAAQPNVTLSTLDAWLGALCFSFQIYFDFSAYSDIAIGIAALFGMHLSLNFNSPYKATSMIEFWRRWHITLSDFLKNYLYIPLGGNRKGQVRRAINLMITMLLGGLWHGASWNFVIWGGLHGLFLGINHIWRAIYPSTEEVKLTQYYLSNFSSWVLTLLCVVVAWVFFRAIEIDDAIKMIFSMFVPNLTPSSFLNQDIVWIAYGVLGASILVLTPPNSVQLALCLHKNIVDPTSINLAGTARNFLSLNIVNKYAHLIWPFLGISAGTATISILWIFMFSLSQDIPFIYFQF